MTPNFTKSSDGLLPAVVQDHASGEVLMLAYMNQEAWNATLNTGRATYFSRSRQALWVKGETSGHIQEVAEIRIDCDQDTILIKVHQVGGAACHTGHRSCFFTVVDEQGGRVVETPVFDPKEVYSS